MWCRCEPDLGQSFDTHLLFHKVHFETDEQHMSGSIANSFRGIERYLISKQTLNILLHAITKCKYTNIGW